MAAGFTQAQMDQVRAVMAEELEKLLEQLPNKAEQLRHGKEIDALAVRVAGLAKDLPAIAGFGTGATPAQVRQIVAEAVQPLPSGSVEALRTAAPRLFDKELVMPAAPDVGTLSKHWWLVESDGPPAHVPGGGMVKHPINSVLDERHHPVAVLKAQGVQIRKLYLPELERHGVRE